MLVRQSSVGAPGLQELPVTTKTAAASSGQLANNTSVPAWPVLHTNASVASWPMSHSQRQSGLIASVASSSTPHSQHQCGFMSNVPQPAPVWPCAQISHSQHQCGLMSNVSQLTSVWPCVQCPTASTSVALCPMSHSHCQRGLMSSIP
ncbi:hypothetical protein TURU_094782 [Turdus rufiventris]|nr:hypothetical protein TURU_094782 [Turdus rufiventris]